MSYFLCQIYELLEGNFTSDALNWQMTILNIDKKILKNENIEQKAVFGEDKFVLFGDQGYGLLVLLITPFPGAPDNIPAQQLQFNQSMKVLRIAVE